MRNRFAEVQRDLRKFKHGRTRINATDKKIIVKAREKHNKYYGDLTPAQKREVIREALRSNK